MNIGAVLHPESHSHLRQQWIYILKTSLPLVFNQPLYGKGNSHGPLVRGSVLSLRCLLLFRSIVSPLCSQGHVCKHQGHQGIPPFFPMSTHSHFGFTVSSTSPPSAPSFPHIHIAHSRITVVPTASWGRYLDGFFSGSPGPVRPGRVLGCLVHMFFFSQIIF